MSSCEIGFLSDDLKPWSDSVLKEHAAEFALSHDLNRAAMSLLRKVEVAGARQIASAAFLARGLQSYQAALLLLERGMLALALGFTWSGLFEVNFTRVRNAQSAILLWT